MMIVPNRALGVAEGYLCSLLAASLLVACSDGQAQRQDGSVDAHVDVMPVDAGPRCTADFLGKPCRQQNECGNKGACLRDVDQEVGVCVCPCTADDPATAVNEDDCPRPGRYICGTVAPEGTATEERSVCLERCSPQLGFNQCKAPLACRPESILITRTRQAVCAGVGCTAHWDCPVWTSRECDPQGDAGEPCPDRHRCEAHEQSGLGGLCVLPGNCDRASGLCAPREAAGTFKEDAAVGDPCADDTRCGARMFCLREINEAATLVAEGADCERADQCCSRECTDENTCGPGACQRRFRNGYCTVRACDFDKLVEFRCPEGSACNRFYSPGLCQRDCDPGDGASCRGAQSIDKRGDYECRIWSQIKVAGEPMAPGPVCDFGQGVPCDLFAADGLSCAVFGVTKNATDMSCRDLNGTKKDDRFDPAGYCLDNTSSGGAR